jgi:hypothetical protein
VRRRRDDPFDPERYWDRRYETGRTSGAGSEGYAAQVKAEYINSVVADWGVKSIVDWGCGDGEVFRQITDSVGYTGVDISLVAISRLATWYPDRTFHHLPSAPDGLEADMAMSLDVIFHLPSDRDFVAHLHQVFGSARQLVLIHATDHDGGRTAKHVRWRRWTPSIPRGWRVVDRPGDPTREGFYLVERSGGVVPDEVRAGW